MWVKPDAKSRSLTNGTLARRCGRLGRPLPKHDLESLPGQSERRAQGLRGGCAFDCRFATPCLQVVTLDGRLILRRVPARNQGRTICQGAEPPGRLDPGSRAAPGCWEGRISSMARLPAQVVTMTTSALSSSSK
jgi:hypothetical protein